MKLEQDNLQKLLEGLTAIKGSIEGLKESIKHLEEKLDAKIINVEEKNNTKLKNMFDKFETIQQDVKDIEATQDSTNGCHALQLNMMADEKREGELRQSIDKVNHELLEHKLHTGAKLNKIEEMRNLQRKEANEKYITLENRLKTLEPIQIMLKYPKATLLMIAGLYVFSLPEARKTVIDLLQVGF